MIKRSLKLLHSKVPAHTGERGSVGGHGRPWTWNSESRALDLWGTLLCVGSHMGRWFRPDTLTERARSGPGKFEAPPGGMNSKSFAELACRPSAKKRRLVSMGKRAGSQRAQHSHLAQALSVTLGEHGELQGQSQQLRGGHGRTHLRIRRDRTLFREGGSAQGSVRVACTVCRCRPADCMGGGLLWVMPRARIRP